MNDNKIYNVLKERLITIGYSNKEADCYMNDFRFIISFGDQDVFLKEGDSVIKAKKNGMSIEFESKYPNTGLICEIK